LVRGDEIAILKYDMSFGFVDEVNGHLDILILNGVFFLDCQDRLVLPGFIYLFQPELSLNPVFDRFQIQMILHDIDENVFLLHLVAVVGLHLIDSGESGTNVVFALLELKGLTSAIGVGHQGAYVVLAPIPQRVSYFIELQVVQVVETDFNLDGVVLPAELRSLDDHLVLSREHIVKDELVVRDLHVLLRVLEEDLYRDAVDVSVDFSRH